MTLTKSQPDQSLHVYGTKVDIHKAVSSLSPKVQAAIPKYINKGVDLGYISPQNVQELMQITNLTLEQLMLDLVPFATAFAYPPISNFQVGAVVHGISGALYLGANIEFVNEALSFCAHAEQSAIAHAINYGETGVDYLAISAAPCGYCRQFLYEILVQPGPPTYSDITILLPNLPSVKLTDLLPNAFGPQDLNVTTRLMQPQNNKLQMVPPPTDPVIVAALKAANSSYAPYTSDFSGVCIQTKSGQIYAGAYAENAAYNPSMSPLEAALIVFLMNQESFSDLSRAVLVEASNSKCSQFDATTNVLRSIAPNVNLQYYQANVI